MKSLMWLATFMTVLSDRSLSSAREKQMNRWIKAFIFDWLGIVACFYLWALVWAASGPWLVLLVPLLVVLGSLQHALGILAHDGSHRLICNDPKVNDAWAWACFLPLGGCLPSYRKFHSAHHAYVGQEGKDPELEHVHHPVLGSVWKLPVNLKSFWLDMLAPLMGKALPHILMGIKLAGATLPKHKAMIGGFFTLAGVVLWYFGLLWVVPVWFAALLSSFWIFMQLRIFTEHVGADPTHVWMPPLWMRVLTHPHNVWLHDAHHRNPDVPFHRLELSRGQQPMSARELIDKLRN